MVEFLGSFMYIIISFDYFLSYFCPLISFSFLIALSKVSSTVLSGYGESGQPCLVPYLNGIALSFCLFGLILAVDLLVAIVFSKTFIIKGCWTLLQFGLLLCTVILNTGPHSLVAPKG